MIGFLRGRLVRVATLAAAAVACVAVAADAAGTKPSARAGQPAVAPAVPDTNLFVSAAAGVRVRKPASWRFLTRNDVIENRRRIRLKDGEWDSLMQKQASLPLVVIAKYPEVHESLNPTCSILVRTIGPFGGMSPTEMLQVTTDQLARVFKGYEVAAPVESTEVSGLPAAKMRMRYTLEVPEHGTFRVLSRLWMVPRPPMLLMIGQGGPTEGPDLSEEEFESILGTVKIDP